MAKPWTMLALLPVMIICFIVFGMELALYLAASLIGLALWIYSEDPLLKMIGGYVGRFGTIFLIVALLYYLFSGRIFPENPFEFKILITAGKFFADGLNWIARTIGGLFIS